MLYLTIPDRGDFTSISLLKYPNILLATLNSMPVLADMKIFGQLCCLSSEREIPCI